MLPKNLKYGSRVESAAARSIRSNVPPNNGTSGYNLGDTIVFNIPTRANLVMACSENYLKFDFSVKNESTAASSYRWDSCGAHGIIQRIRIYHGSNLIEDIDNYGLLAKMMFDLQVPTDATYGKYSITTGCRSDLVVSNLGATITPATADIDKATNVYNAITNGTLSAIQINSGEMLGRGIAANASTGVFTYNLNLLSVIGSLCNNQYFPLFACTSSPIRVEIQLVSQLSHAMCCTSNGGSIKIENMEYVANFIELSDAAMSMINQSLNGQPLQFVIPQYRNYAWSGVNTLTDSIATSISFPIAAKFSSLKSIFVTCRDKGTGAIKFFPFSSVSKGVSEYSFRIGPNVFPPKSPSRISEMFCETCKAIGSLSDLNHQPSIEKTSYFLTDSIEANLTTDSGYNSVNSGSFYIGLDLENYSNADKSSIFAGYNSNTDDIYCNISYSGKDQNLVPITTSTTMRWDSFVSFDSVYVFENNTCYIRF